MTETMTRNNHRPEPRVRGDICPLRPPASVRDKLQLSRMERLRKQEKEHNWYLVGQFFNALADYEVTVFEAKNGRGPVIEVHDPETGKKVSVALTRTTNG